jgi:hypothetical protein
MKKEVRTLRRCVAQAFPPENDYVDQYLAAIRENMHSAWSSVAREAILLIALGTAFELLNHAAVSKTSLGPNHF